MPTCFITQKGEAARSYAVSDADRGTRPSHTSVKRPIVHRTARAVSGMEKVGAFFLGLVAVPLYWIGTNWLTQLIYPTCERDPPDRKAIFYKIIFAFHIAAATGAYLGFIWLMFRR